MKSLLAICFIFAAEACFGQVIQSYTFVTGKQITPADSIKIKVYMGTNSSNPFYDGFTKSNDTLYVNFRNCEGMLAFYSNSTLLCTLPPQPTGHYKVKIRLRSVKLAQDASCTIPYATAEKLDSIEVSALFTGIVNKIATSTPINLYPNPVVDRLTVEFKGSAHEKNNISIINSLGQIVYYDEITTFTKAIDLHALNAGVYYLKAQNGSASSVTRIIKE